mgnify:CR=1 FL=1
MNRREVIKTGLLASGTIIHPGFAKAKPSSSPIGLKGNIHHAVCQWTYDFMSINYKIDSNPSYRQ